MISSIFNKSRPIIFLLIVLVFSFCFILFQLRKTYSIFSILENSIVWIILILSGFLINFIVKKNGLSKDNIFTFLLFFLFILLFPSILNERNLVICNLLIIISLRRLLSLQSLIATREKIFDATLWILIASFFHFWSILFLILVFTSIISIVTKNIKNWIIPFIALLTIINIYIFKSLLLSNKYIIQNILNKVIICFNFDVINNIPQNIFIFFFMFIALLFFVSQMFSLPERPIAYHSNHRKIIFAFVIAIIIFCVSCDKNSSLLIFVLTPLSIMGSNYLENFKKERWRDLFLSFLIFASFISFLFYI